MALINTSTHPKSLWPGIYKFWGKDYKEHPMEWKDLFEMHTSDQAYEEVQESIATGLAPAKSEGSAITFDATAQGVTNRATHVVYALGAIITQEALDDNLYEKKSKQIVPSLNFSMRQTKEIVLANAYNRAFNTSYLFADGDPIISTSHATYAGSQSNRLASNAPLSEIALEDLTIQIMDAQTSRGHRFGLMPKSLHVSTNDFYNATRILKSTLQNDTAENAINALRFHGIFPEGAKINHYFDSNTAFFIRTNAPCGMMFFQRKPIEFDQDNDFDTRNARFLVMERYGFTIGDWRGLFGSSG